MSISLSHLLKLAEKLESKYHNEDSFELSIKEASDNEIIEKFGEKYRMNEYKDHDTLEYILELIKNLK